MPQEKSEDQSETHGGGKFAKVHTISQKGADAV